MARATKLEIAEARGEKAYWRSVAAIMGVTCDGWDAMRYGCFHEGDGAKFSISRTTAENIRQHTGLAKEVR